MKRQRIQSARIQLKRAAGFRLQEASHAINGLPCVKVDRTTKWGNPFKVGPGRSREHAVKLFGEMLRGYICLSGDSPTPEEQEAYRAVVIKDHAELDGKNLACWCRPGDPCHADVLMGLNHEALRR